MIIIYLMFFDFLFLVYDEFDVFVELVLLCQQVIIEFGCGNVCLVCDLLWCWLLCQVMGLEVDVIQYVKNLECLQVGLYFVVVSVEVVFFDGGLFDLVLMFKLLYYVFILVMDMVFVEVVCVLCLGGLFYVSEFIYGGVFNEVVCLYNDEGVVCLVVQVVLDCVLVCGGYWEFVVEWCFV